ncbi:hypothetical protein DFH09DRAFT_1321724 [Mycena vulgaris]|nr:hypothetical protein DFH09DRAFT_1321724 [Mycena vulgaris]
MENLIADSNRSAVTYAITTLLETGNKTSVKFLIKQITRFMSEISNEFKIIMIRQTIHSFCLKVLVKHAVMLTFLSGIQVFRNESFSVFTCITFTFPKDYPHTLHPCSTPTHH